MWTRAGKWARRRPVHAALLILLGVSAMAVVAALVWSRVRDDELRFLSIARAESRPKLSTSAVKRAGSVCWRSSTRRHIN